MNDDICKKKCFFECLEKTGSISKQLKKCMKCEHNTNKVHVISKMEFESFKKNRDTYASVRTKSGSFKKINFNLKLLEYIKRTDPTYYVGVRQDFMVTNSIEEEQ